MTKTTWLLPALASGFLLLAPSRQALAQDAAVINPRTVRVKLDNDRVRVLEATLKPGEREKLHSHPSSIIYVIAGGNVRNHSADGKSSESKLATGDTIYRDPVTHWAENIGKTTIRLILVELKGPSLTPVASRP